MTRERSTGEMLLVWVDAWQMQCCGDPFAAGSHVEWTLEASDREWLGSVVGEDLAARVTHSEEHHRDLPDDAPITTGVVIRIRAVSCLFGPDPRNVSAAAPEYPISGTATIVEVDDADGWYPESDERRFNGYLVDLQRAEA